MSEQEGGREGAGERLPVSPDGISDGIRTLVSFGSNALMKQKSPDSVCQIPGFTLTVEHVHGGMFYGRECQEKTLGGREGGRVEGGHYGEKKTKKKP